MSELRTALDSEILRLHDVVTLRAVGPGQVAEVKLVAASSVVDEVCFRIQGKDVWLPWGDIIDITLRETTLWDHVAES